MTTNPRIMTRRAIFLAAWGVLVCLSPSPSVPAEAPDRAFVLDNGLRVFLHEKHELPLLNVVTAFDVGSKNETDSTSGLVHLLEHCILFRGTAHRTGEEVSADIRRHGAYFNANTGQDLSVFEISLPAEQAEFALRNQKDILFHLEVSQAEIDEEKEVILEEFNQMEDDPQKSATDLVLQALFPDHPYGRSVYGRREVIRAATVEDVLGFYRKFFVADNCVLAIIGDFVTDDMERMVREVFGPLPRTGFSPGPCPMAAALTKSVAQRRESDVQDGYLFLGFVAPDYNHPDQYAMNVLTEVLGRGINPLLPALLRRERDSLQTVNMSYLANRYGGAVVLSIRADPKDIKSLERAAVGYLKRARNEAYSKRDFQGDDQLYAFDYLESAKNQIRFAVGRAEESGLRLAGSLARHMLLNTREKPGRYLDEIGRVDSSDLRKVAAKYLSRGEFAAVSILPKKRDE
jgi:zinc protease